MSIIERGAFDFGLDHFKGVSRVLEVGAGSGDMASVTPSMFAPDGEEQLYLLIDNDPALQSPGAIKYLEQDFNRPGLTIRYETADATRLSPYYGLFDAVFMKNFLGDRRISEEDRTVAIEESLLCLQKAKVLGASALWAVETYTPLIAERYIGKLAAAFPTLTVEHARVWAYESRQDPRLSERNYPIRLRFNPEYIDIYKITHTK